MAATEHQVQERWPLSKAAPALIGAFLLGGMLVGIEHDGKTGEWSFSGWRIVDLSTLRVRLKPEFQASNADLYQKSSLTIPTP